jgi:hypothetical protein
MQEKVELHLTYDRGTPKGMGMTVYITQEIADKFLALKREKKMTIEEAYDKTEELNHISPLIFTILSGLYSSKLFCTIYISQNIS